MNKNVPETYRVAAFYSFVSLSEYKALRPILYQRGADLDLCGTILLAPEGINSTLAGSSEAVDRFIQFLTSVPAIGDLNVKYSEANERPFRKWKVRLKKEIVTMAQPSANPAVMTGTHVPPEQWNALIEKGNIPVLDTRNDYEVEIGTFENAINPNTESFTEFADFVEKNLDPKETPEVAMFCTGGIRCEKASSYMLAKGFKNVFQLEGGILKYLETVPEEKSRWNGECYVFDKRVSVGHGLKQGPYEACFSCGRPITQKDKNHPHFEVGVTCPKCYGSYSEERLARFRERQHQIELGRNLKQKF